MAADFTEKRSTLPPGFRQAADSASPITEPPRVMVSLSLDADLLAHFQSETEPGNWQRHINDVLRFYVETSQMADADAELAMQMAQDAPRP